MPARKTPAEKLRTKINGILRNNPELSQRGNRIYFEDQLLLSFNTNSVTYSRRRYYPTRENRIGQAEYAVSILLSDQSVNIVSSIKPQSITGKIFNLFRGQVENEINRIIIGSNRNGISGSDIEITFNLYETFKTINQEEKRDETIRFNTRVHPLLENNYGFGIEIPEQNIDWGVRLQEIIASGEVTQSDIQTLAEQLEPGSSVNYVVERQVNKQVSWLLSSIEQILDEGNLNVGLAKNLGIQIFGYPRTSIKGPEHLMERILTDYGQHTLFGVPALVNTGKFVLNQRLPRAQFDLLLINSLGEIEVVELKRSDTIVLEFDTQRNKFYASSELSKAIAQTERYITSVMKDNDREYLINNQTVREYLNNELGDLINVESVRPTGLIIIGSARTLAAEYEDLSETTRNRISRNDYYENCDLAYRELKDSHKNIKIITYSGLLQSARMRLQLSDVTE